MEGWAERVSELEAEMSRCEVAHGAMLQDVATKDERIMVRWLYCYTVLWLVVLYLDISINNLALYNGNLEK